ncbi:MAG: IPTL-CTERM sorting domain-containing protein, partial [Acidobacteriota bacterium]|nr:IPTL-CTERM sorting domain-containing protein [Acidobacteriota bacterium]
MSVAAAPAAGPFSFGSPSGPFPGPFDSTQLTEPFSSDGPRRIYFDSAGNLLPGAPAGNFSSTGGVVRQKPNVTAADGVSCAAPGFNPFYGTSAAAPHAAAIAGLVKAAFPGFTPAQVRTALETSAIDILAPGVDRDSGAGIVMAFQTLQNNGAKPQANLTLGTPAPSEIFGNHNAFIETGETWALALPLQNIGGAAASGITATLSTTTPGVSINQATASYSDIPPGGTGTNFPLFSFTSGAPCGTILQFTLTVSSTGGNNSPQTFSFSLPTGAPGTPVKVSYSGPAVPIPDAVSVAGVVVQGTATASLNVSGLTGRIFDLKFSFDGTTCTTAAAATTVGVDHTFINDLVFQLKSPAGTIVTILNQIDLNGHNLCQVLLDDNSSGPSIETANSTQAPFTGSWKPANPLAAFKGENPNGTWQLIGSDQAPQDSGSMRAFSLIITPAACGAQAIGVIPTLSDIGLAALAVLLLASATLVLRRKRLAAPALDRAEPAGRADRTGRAD